MALESEPIRENNQTPDAGGESDVQASNTKPNIPPTPSVPTLPPTKPHCEITCKTEKDWWDKWKPFVEIIGIALLAIYTGYTIKMYYANKEAADAAQEGSAAASNAARIAGNSLLLSQTSFQIEQRPYVVADIPEFVVSPIAPGKIRASVTFKNIGRTPAIKIKLQIALLRLYPAKRETPGGVEKFIAFMEASYQHLLHKLDASATEKYAEMARQDLAPNASQFSTAELKGPLSATEIPLLQTSDLTLFYIGVVRYTDAYKGSYETMFCYFYFGNDPRTWHICDNHNIIK